MPSTIDPDLPGGESQKIDGASRDSFWSPSLSASPVEFVSAPPDSPIAKLIYNLAKVITKISDTMGNKVQH